MSLPILSANGRSPTAAINRAGGGCSGRCEAWSPPPVDSPGGVPFLGSPQAVSSAVGPMATSPFEGTAAHPEGLMIGLDVGSTTVKAVVVDGAADGVLWSDYQRHETRQAEKVLELLDAVAAAFPEVPERAFRLFLTGSGATALRSHLGGKFVQEVNALSLAVEKLHPEVESVIELGGQDAKIIVFRQVEGGKKKIPSMNDKCAGGTGAVIDKINAKLKIPPDKLGAMGYDGIKLYPVAGKCGVFAETDVNSLQKQGAPPAELMASLFESIIQQNLSVLTRGHTLRPTVLLLGGPNTFIKGMRECWQHHLPIIWQERGVELPEAGGRPEDYIVTPENAQLFAAIGAVELGKAEVADDPQVGRYAGRGRLRAYLDHGRDAEKAAAGLGGLWQSEQELTEFKRRYRRQPWEPARFRSGQVVEAIIGIDGGSTSTKAVLLAPDETVLAKAYQLSKQNPIRDTIEVLGELERQVTQQGARLEVLAVGTTGYAKDTLKSVLSADVALVETVAHTEACLHDYPGTDVIVDVGGQDIKLITLKDGRVKDFKLNTQCSAGNGYFLQSTAADFGFDVTEYAEEAFSARSMPEFGYGCAVFMQSNIVDFQRRGWQPNEILAGLAAVLPKNVWLYVAKIPNMALLGSKFVLQGGTQRNLAVVKAQVDFIRSRYRGQGVEPEILVHRHCGVSGAIGSALEAHRLWSESGRATTFIGLDRVRKIRYQTTHNEETRCWFCKNSCLRTFIDVYTGAGAAVAPGARKRAAPEARKRNGAAPPANGNGKGAKSKVPLAPGFRRLIISTCEKGAVEDVDAMRQIKAGLDGVKKANPNIPALASKTAFRAVKVDSVASVLPAVRWWDFLNKGELERRRTLTLRRRSLRIGIPRVLNMYAQAPFFIGFFTSLGVPYKNLVFSAYTDQELYKRGARRGSIDPCYPSKLGIAHVHDLLYRVHRKKPLSHIFFPMVDTFPTWLHGVQASRACPTVVATADVTHAAFIKEGDLFADAGIVFKKTFLNLDEPLLCARQMAQDWGDELGLSETEARRAVAAGLEAMEAWLAGLRERSREILDTLERDNRIGIVVLGRPYHNDPGLNHGILEELQKLGYPVLWQDALPRDRDLIERLFGDEVQAGEIDHPMSVEDAWKNSYQENSDRKIWAARYVARHPNLVAVELSSFKCGHDAPIYTVIEETVENSGTPYFGFKDIDENRPVGSIKVRTETIGYFLARFSEQLAASAR